MPSLVKKKEITDRSLCVGDIEVLYVAASKMVGCTDQLT